MTFENADGYYNEDARHAREQEARAAFKGLLDQTGLTIIEQSLVKAQDILENGGKGYAIETTDHSIVITIDAYNVHFSTDSFREYTVPLDTAKVAMFEIREEQVLGQL